MPSSTSASFILRREFSAAWAPASIGGGGHVRQPTFESGQLRTIHAGKTRVHASAIPRSMPVTVGSPPLRGGEISRASPLLFCRPDSLPRWLGELRDAADTPIQQTRGESHFVAPNDSVSAGRGPSKRSGEAANDSPRNRRSPLFRSSPINMPAVI